MHKRGFVSLLTLFGFLIMSATGLVLYISPVGRVAYWINWEMIGLTKTGWGNIHILSSILFLVAGAFHIYFNWKPLLNYFKDKARKGVKLRRELAVSSIIAVWILVSAIWLLPPLSYLIDLNEWIKETWVIQYDYDPPFGHAELLSLRVFSKKMDIDLKKAVEELRANGIVFDNVEETLEDIGRTNNISPMNLYLLIKKFEAVPETDKLKSYTPESIEVEFSGTGIGNKTIGSICKRLGIEPDLAVSRLIGAGVSVDLNTTMKAAAESAGCTPIEIMKVLLLEGYQLKDKQD